MRRQTPCIYNPLGDQRRKIVQQRNLRELGERNRDLERHHVLLGGLVASLQVGDDELIHGLVDLVRTRIDLPDLAAYVDFIMANNPIVYEAYKQISFYMDDSPLQPSVARVVEGGGDRLEEESAAQPELAFPDGTSILHEFEDAESQTPGKALRLHSRHPWQQSNVGIGHFPS